MLSNAYKQEIDDINSQVNALNDSSIDSIAKITKIYGINTRTKD